MSKLKTVLVVDDSLSIREAVGFILQNEGYQVIKAESAKNALESIEGKQIDLVITDLHMPEINGIELTKEIRKLTDFSHTPILVLTTESQVSKKMEAKLAGATGWIVKPFVTEKLIAVIKKVLR
jgi:two-component system chemotaxis response regulator CheY